MAGILGQKSRLYMKEYVKEQGFEFEVDLKTTFNKRALVIERSFLS